ncbi:MAG TPA: hydroxymethylbilane synthase, partial [Planctomycetota bacterium]|nr:hydroxymethylbilane synthase [Planctomycetota bacterium]
LAKLETEGLAGTILAHAGLRRLGREEVVTEVLTIDAFVPAVGQGAIAIVARADDAETRSVLEAIEDEGTRAEIEAERAYLAELRGGCQVPAGALARRREESLEIVAVIASPDGRELVRGSLSGATTDARSLGEELARRLLREGGARLLEGMRE